MLLFKKEWIKPKRSGNMDNRLTVKETVKGDIERVFNAFTDGDELVNWYSASPGWTTPYAYSELTPEES